MKKLVSMFLAITIVLAMSACGDTGGAAKPAETTAEAAAQQESETAIQQESETAIQQESEAGRQQGPETVTQQAAEAGTGQVSETNLTFSDIAGIYEELFTVICDPQYDQLWLDDCKAIVGDDMAQDCADMLKSACTGTIYGEEAVEAYKESPEEGRFDCFFTNNVRNFVFDGNSISGTDEKGETLFSHEYSYVEEMSVGGMMEGSLFETQDADAGEFRYFLIFPDTPATTYHIEFRYGSDREALSKYFEGPYAYWLAGGIPVERDDAMVENCIQLFVEENLAEMAGGDATSESAVPEDRNGNTGENVSVVEISTAQELLDFARSVTDGSAGGYAGQTVVLTDDIDCSGISWEPAGTMDINDMGRQDCLFQGIFDGQGHTISNVAFTTDTPVCGAGIIGVNLGEVKNLRAENIRILCADPFSMAIGGIVGYNMGLVHDCTLDGENEIAGVNCTGGIAGGSMGTVYNCTVSGTTIRVLGDNDFSSGRIIQCDVAECGGLVIGGSFGGTIDNCTASGTVAAEGNEPVGLGGIAGCLEMMDSITNCSANVEIISEKGGHAIGGLCGYSGTHSIKDVIAETEGVTVTEYPAIVDNCRVTVNMNIPGATHVGGLIGTGLYYYGEETAFKVTNCSAKGEISGAVTPGAVAGRAENSVIESCEAEITVDGEILKEEVGRTSTMYESADQFEEEQETQGAA